MFFWDLDQVRRHVTSQVVAAVPTLVVHREAVAREIAAAASNRQLVPRDRELDQPELPEDLGGPDRSSRA